MQKPKIEVKDLTKEAPRSPRERLGGYVLLARAIDKGRAALAGKAGEYKFDCPNDKRLFDFKGISGGDFKAAIARGSSDDELVRWVNEHGSSKTPAEVKAWSDETEADDYSSRPIEKQQWLIDERERLGIPPNATLFNYLDADDKASFPKAGGL